MWFYILSGKVQLRKFDSKCDKGILLGWLFKKSKQFMTNNFPCLLLQNKSLHNLLFNQTPNFLDFKVFGSLCYASTLYNHQGNIEPRDVLFGYKSGMKAIALYKNLIVNNFFFKKCLSSWTHFPLQIFTFRFYTVFYVGLPPHPSPCLIDTPTLLSSTSHHIPLDYQHLTDYVWSLSNGRSILISDLLVNGDFPSRSYSLNYYVCWC